MEKSQIETFIRKYNLGGAIEGVMWVNDNENLKTTVVTSDKKLFTCVQLEKGADFFKDVEIGIQDTTRLKRFLSPLDDKFTFSLDIDENDKTRVRKLLADDGKVTIDYITAEKSHIDAVPSLKNIPPFTVEINLTEHFINAFLKGFSALGDDKTLFTLIMSKKKQKLELVLGYRQNNHSDRIAISLDTAQGKDTVKAPISFSAKHFKEILSVNENPDNAILRIAEQGIAYVNFDKDGFKSDYYMVKVEVDE